MTRRFLSTLGRCPSTLISDLSVRFSLSPPRNNGNGFTRVSKFDYSQQSHYILNYNFLSRLASKVAGLGCRERGIVSAPRWALAPLKKDEHWQSVGGHRATRGLHSHPVLASTFESFTSASVACPLVNLTSLLCKQAWVRPLRALLRRSSRLGWGYTYWTRSRTSRYSSHSDEFLLVRIRTCKNLKNKSVQQNGLIWRAGTTSFVNGRGKNFFFMHIGGRVNFVKIIYGFK